MHASGRSNRFVLAALALMCVGAVACHEDAVAPRTIQTPSGPMKDLGITIFDVDLKRGTVTPRRSGGSGALPPGVSARFFGKPTIEIEYLFSGQDQGTPGPSAEYNLHLNISNLLAFPIGTHYPYTYPFFPQDTMGIYAYYVYEPYAFTSEGSPCVPNTCTVVIDSMDGSYPFTTVNPQKYVYWKSILQKGGLNASDPGPFETNQSGVGGGSGVNYYRRVSFKTTGSVSTFAFGMAIAAPWVYPHDNRFKVFYVADSLPFATPVAMSDSNRDLRSEPNWRRLGTTGAATITPGGCTPNTGACNLSLVSTLTDSLIFYRSDSIGSADLGYISATVQTPALSAIPSVFLGLKDPVKLVQLGISSSVTGFTDSTGVVISGSTVATDTTRHSYRIAKFGADSAVIYSPSNVRLVSIKYDSLPPAPVRGSGPPNYDRFFFFGNLTAATSLWSNVNYEIGATGP